MLDTTKSPNAQMDKLINDLRGAKNKYGEKTYFTAVQIGKIAGLTRAEQISALQCVCRLNGAYENENHHHLEDQIKFGLEKGRLEAGLSLEDWNNTPRTNGTTLETKAASAFKVRGIRWFWKNRFALGKLGLIGGMPDKGKGLISADLIACATAEHPFPCDEGIAPQGSVIYFTAEDDIEDTVVPRLIAAGANLDRVHIVQCAKEKDGKGRTFSMVTDLEALRAKLTELQDVVLVIIDPMSAYVGVGKVNNSMTTDVRGFLKPLTDLAAEKGVCTIGIMHFNKKVDVANAMLRIADSLAYVAAARHVYFVVDDPEEEKRRLFVEAKNNLAPDVKALSYRVGLHLVGTDEETGQEIHAPNVIWGAEHIEMSASEAMQAEAGGASGRAQRREAKEFLRERLADGPVLQAELVAEAEQLGISKSTLDRAKKDLGVKPRKGKGLDKGWTWELPNG